VYRKPFKGPGGGGVVIATQKCEKRIKRADYTALDLFSIDPLGCHDIDDAFSIECLSPTRTRLGVHIAQPIAFLDLDMITDRLQQGAFSTLYCEPVTSETRPLWGQEIETASSLLEGKIRPAYSIFFILDNGVIVSDETTSMPTYVENKLSTHYDDVSNPLVQQLVEQTRRILHDTMNMQDTHDVVAYWMIQANRYIGSAFPKLQLPFRVQQERSYEPTTVYGNLPQGIHKAFQQFSMDKARYSIDPDDQHHASLGMERYVHFTSPIRRIMDTMIHYQITYGTPLEWEKYLDRLCELDRATHRFHRMCRLVGVIDELFPPSCATSTNPLELTGYLYEKIERGRWRVYFEQLGFVKIRVVSQELLHLFPEEQEEAEYPVGKALPFLVYSKTEGFLPMERILILPGWKVFSCS
jgi:exoribonuclease R